VAAVVTLMFGEPLAGRESARAKAADAAAPSAGDWRVLATWPVMLNLVLFILIASFAVGMQNYAIVALDALWRTPLSLSTTALTVHLMCSAFAVLVGGWLASRTARHETIALIGLFVSGVALIPIAFVDLNATLLIALMAVSGFFNGLLQPSRDMIVRSVTPPGAFGRVFGFVTTGFNIGGVIAPPAFGYMMDAGAPAGVILGTAALALTSIPVIVLSVAQRRQASLPV
jgi:FSR family fosmidomycin resistance protein-like MFS transporter